MISPIGYWKRIDKNVIQNPPAYLEEDDDCYFVLERIAGKDYRSSPANQLISNFKRDPIKFSTNSGVMYYKSEAIKNFASQLATIKFDPPKHYIFTNIPTSQKRNSDKYDNRFESTFEELLNARPELQIEYPIDIIQNHKPVHHGHRFNPEDIYNNLKWTGLSQNYKTIFLIDDTITAGAHFKACQRLILENEPDIEILGLFWARSIWPESPHQNSPDAYTLF